MNNYYQTLSSLDFTKLIISIIRPIYYFVRSLNVMNWGKGLKLATFQKIFGGRPLLRLWPAWWGVENHTPGKRVGLPIRPSMTVYLNRKFFFHELWSLLSRKSDKFHPGEGGSEKFAPGWERVAPVFFSAPTNYLRQIVTATAGGLSIWDSSAATFCSEPVLCETS